MKLIELLNKIDVKTLFDSQIERLFEFEKRPTTQEEYEITLNNFEKKLEKIKTVELIKVKDSERLIVAYVKRFAEDEYGYEAFMMNGDGERYDITCSPWGELLDMQVLQKSIMLYGETEVAAEIFWNMTFMGLTEEQHKDECAKLEKSLIEAVNCPLESCRDGDEVFRELEEEMREKSGEARMPRKELSEEEELIRKERMQADWEECEKLYKMLNECVILEKQIDLL